MAFTIELYCEQIIDVILIHFQTNFIQKIIIAVHYY